MKDEMELTKWGFTLPLGELFLADFWEWKSQSGEWLGIGLTFVARISVDRHKAERQG